MCSAAGELRAARSGWSATPRAEPSSATCGSFGSASASLPVPSTVPPKTSALLPSTVSSRSATWNVALASTEDSPTWKRVVGVRATPSAIVTVVVNPESPTRSACRRARTSARATVPVIAGGGWARQAPCTASCASTVPPTSAPAAAGATLARAASEARLDSRCRSTDGGSPGCTLPVTSSVASPSASDARRTASTSPSRPTSSVAVNGTSGAFANARAEPERGGGCVHRRGTGEPVRRPLHAAMRRQRSGDDELARHRDVEQRSGSRRAPRRRCRRASTRDRSASRRAPADRQWRPMLPVTLTFAFSAPNSAACSPTRTGRPAVTSDAEACICRATSSSAGSRRRSTYRTSPSRMSASPISSAQVPRSSRDADSARARARSRCRPSVARFDPR